MFSGCKSLKRILCNSDIAAPTSLATSNKNMAFYNCTSLRGSKMAFDSSKTTGDYLTVDSGYMTKLVYTITLKAESDVDTTGIDLTAKKLAISSSSLLNNTKATKVLPSVGSDKTWVLKGNSLEGVTLIDNSDGTQSVQFDPAKDIYDVTVTLENAEDEVVATTPVAFSASTIRNLVYNNSATSLIFTSDYDSSISDATDVSKSSDGSVKAWLDGTILYVAPTDKDYYLQPTDITGLCRSCPVLQRVDFGNMDLSQVIALTNIFYACYKLESVDFSKVRKETLASITGDCQLIAYGCSLLKSLDLSWANFSNCGYMTSAFSGCTSLTTIYSRPDEAAGTQTSNYTFNNCTSLSSPSKTYSSADVTSYYFRVSNGYLTPKS
jgi:hypothetical protein